MSLLPLSHPTICRESHHLHDSTSSLVVYFSLPPSSLPAMPSPSTAAQAARESSLEALATLPDLTTILPRRVKVTSAPPPASAAAIRLGLVSDPREGRARRRAARAAAEAARMDSLGLPNLDSVGVIELCGLELDPHVVVDATGHRLVDVSALVVGYSWMGVWVQIPMVDGAEVGGGRRVFELREGSEGADRLETLLASRPWEQGVDDGSIVFSLLDTSLPLEDQEIAHGIVDLEALIAPGGQDYINERIPLVKVRTAFGPGPRKQKLVSAGTLTLSILLRRALRSTLHRISTPPTNNNE